jgi:hypothetical protein
MALPYTFVNGTVANADEVNQNFKDTFTKHTDFLPIFDFTNWTTSGGQPPTKGWRILHIYAGTGFTPAVAYKELIRSYGIFWLGTGQVFDWNKDFYLGFMFTSSYGIAADSKSWVMVSHNNTAADPTLKSVGFRLDGTVTDMQLALKGLVHNGTTLTIVDLATTIQTGIGSSYSGPVYILALRFKAGQKVEWYVNGVKKGESTLIPTAATATAYFVLGASAPAGYAIQNLNEVIFEQEY